MLSHRQVSVSELSQLRRGHGVRAPLGRFAVLGRLQVTALRPQPDVFARAALLVLLSCSAAAITRCST